MTEKVTFETARIRVVEQGEHGEPGAPESGIESRGSEPLEMLDRYEIRRPLNKGGFATVYEGYDPRIKRAVAIKKCSSLDAENHERFFREAEIAGNLSHPNIVRIFDFGVADGVPFIVQELLGGKDLADWIDAGLQLSRRDRVRILYQIARGLEYAHAHDVIHRDIKPANVRVLEDGSIKLLDFGVAAIQAAPSELTQTGATVGTAAYLAPEQIRGERPSWATDMFSFGVLAYELLSGHRPFEADTLSAILYQIAHDEPEPLRAGAVPRRLVRLIHRCLEKFPEHRFESFEEVAGLLEEILRDPRLSPPSAETVPIKTFPKGVPNSYRPRGDASMPADLPLRPPGPQLATATLDVSSNAVRDSSSRIQVAGSRPRWPRRLAMILLAAAGAVGLYAYRGGDVPGSATRLAELATGNLPAEIGHWVREQFGGTPVIIATDVPEPVPDLILARALDALEAPLPESDPRAPEAPQGQPARRRTGSGPSTVFLPPSWHPAMRVSVDGGEYQRLDRRQTAVLRPGRHTLAFRLDTPSYKASQRLDIELVAGETRSFESPLAPPAALRLATVPADLEGRFEIDGAPLDLLRGRPLILQPGSHELVFLPAPSDPLGPLAKTVELRSATAHLLTFDMRRRRALLEIGAAFEWPKSGS